MKRICLGASALSLVAMHAPALAADDGKTGSAYVQCDGQPDNWTDGETAARFIGAVTLLGLFAPQHEAPDASKRKFGAEGVAACTSLLSGDHQESNAKRRLGLILGRAIHQIEAKNYSAAIADVAMARNEAQAAGFMNDAYFVRSRGRAFDAIESAALLRMGRADEARAASLRSVGGNEFSLFPLFSVATYGEFLDKLSPEEERVEAWRTRIVPLLASLEADRLDLNGRFADSARLRDAMIDFDQTQSPELNSSVFLARSALAHALAGNFAVAAERAKAARANAEQRRADGKPEANEAELVELLDLYSIVDTAHSGDLKAARRLFAARSQWVGISLGSVLEMNRRLRAGAAADDLIGGLARTPEDIWKERVETSRAALLAKDSDNKTLFRLIPAEFSSKAYQAAAKDVWRTDKSKIILKTKADPSKSPMELMFLPLVHPVVAMDAYMLHAALITRSRGQQGFVFMPILTDKLVAASFRSGNRGDKGFPPELFIDANDVIAKLAPLFPQPTS
jgi:hypothetical protein